MDQTTIPERKPGFLSGKRGRRIKAAITGYTFLLPATIVLIAFHFYPVFYAFYISLHKWRIVKQSYVGFANYSRALHDPDFWQALVNTVYYVIGTVPFQLVFALIVAYLLYQDIKGREAYRVSYFLPYITSTIASGAVFAWIFNPNHGPVNQLLKALGLKPLQWLLEPKGIFDLIARAHGWKSVPIHGPSLAMVTIFLFVIWFWLGYDATLFLAGLGNIPKELYEAAEIDGANKWQLFRYITVPLLSPTTFFLTIVAVIGSFKAFNHIFIMNDASSVEIGGPLGTTMTVAILIYKKFYEVPTYGYASAISFLLFFIILAFTLLQNYAGSKHVHYG